MNVAEQIRRKRDGEALPADVIRKLVSGITTGDIPDYQTSALLMAIYFRGLEIHSATRLHGRPWLFLSDHLPLMADFVFG